MDIKIKEVVNYSGHSVKKNGNVDLTFVASYDQMTKSIELLQMLNNNITIECRKPGEKIFSLGVFMVKSVYFDGDGETKIKFNSLDVNVEMNNINRLVTDEPFVIRMSASIDLEEEE